MAQATDIQMQQYADQRIRPRAEQAIRVLNAIIDDVAAIPDVWDRAANGAAWNDARTDGPPTLATSGHVLAYNLWAGVLVKIFNGTATEQEVADFASNWPTVRAMAVNALQV